MFKIQDHRVEGIQFRDTPNKSGSLSPDLLVIHYTATTNGRATIDALCSERLRASAHLVVDTDGTITQLVPFNVRAWHAGKSYWNGRRNCNDFSIGIELVNVGYLTERGGKLYDHVGRLFEGEATEGTHKHGGPWKYWASYATEQMLSLAEVTRAIIAEYGIQEIVGHEDIAPGRKKDPGPAFQWEEFRLAVFDKGALEFQRR